MLSRIEHIRIYLRWILKTILRRKRNILVDLRWRLGDEIMAMPVYEALRKTYPCDTIYVNANYPELLRHNPNIDHINPAHCIPDKYIFLRNDPRFLPRTSYYGKLAGVRLINKRPLLPSESITEATLEEFGYQVDGRPLICVSTGATWYTKRWPVQFWDTVCQTLTQQGYRIIQIGKGDELIPGIESWVDKTSVLQAARLLHESKLFICCDSGLMHLALSIQTPTIALFGPTDPAILVPDIPELIPVRIPNPCKGCWNSTRQDTRLGRCPEKYECCMDTITPDMVLAKTDSFFTAAQGNH